MAFIPSLFSVRPVRFVDNSLIYIELCRIGGDIGPPEGAFSGAGGAFCGGAAVDICRGAVDILRGAGADIRGGVGDLEGVR
jgi:hypothetical protein